MDNAKHSMMVLFAIGIVLISLSVISADDDLQLSSEERTFSAVGDSVGYSQDSFLHAILTREANAQLMQFEVENLNNPTEYNVTISESDYDQLKSAKNNGEMKEIQIKTNQSVIVKQPVIENYTKEIFSKEYYDEETFENDLESLEEKFLFDSDADVNVTNHTNPSNGKDYKKITVNKTFYVVKTFNDCPEQITAHVVVNDMQADGKDWVFFNAQSLGIGGVLASDHIDI